MSVSVASSSPFPMGGEVSQANVMIEYAFSKYNYVMSPAEAFEVATKPYWDDVDAFCTYMLQANFGAPISGTSNVKLPSTIRIYTDEELDEMDAELRGLPATRASERDIQEVEVVEITLGVDYIREDIDELDGIGIYEERDPELSEGEFEGEFLPPYTPEVLPAYDPSDFADPPPPYVRLAQLESILEEDEPEEDTPKASESAPLIGEARGVSMVHPTNEDDGVEKCKGGLEVGRTPKRATLRGIRSSLARKIQRAKQKLARRCEAITR